MCEVVVGRSDMHLEHSTLVEHTISSNMNPEV